MRVPELGNWLSIANAVDDKTGSRLRVNTKARKDGTYSLTFRASCDGPKVYDALIEFIAYLEARSPVAFDIAMKSSDGSQNGDEDARPHTPSDDKQKVEDVPDIVPASTAGVSDDIDIEPTVMPSPSSDDAFINTDNSSQFDVTPAKEEPTSLTTIGGESFELIAKRCRLKAEGCRWAAERLRLKSEGADHQAEIVPFDRQIVERANQLPDCRLWMNSSRSPVPDDPASFDIVGGCFDALAEAMTLASVSSDVAHRKNVMAEVLYVVAEAQSALRSGIQSIDGPTDHDQIQAFQWLKTVAAERKIFIERHITIDDPADPRDWPSILDRIRVLMERVEFGVAQMRKRRKLLNKIKYLLEQTQGTDPDQQSVHWRTIANTVHELVEDGLPPSSKTLRELLLPHIDAAPDLPDMSKGFALAVREMKRAQNGGVTDKQAHRDNSESSDIRRAARLLRGRKLVLIGGDARPARKEALEKAFGLSELTWVETTPGQSVNSFAPIVARPDVAAVVLAIRWASHSYGEVRQFCDKYDKPLVWLPGGYNPNQMAAHILGQCSHRLRQQRSRANGTVE